MTGPKKTPDAPNACSPPKMEMSEMRGCILPDREWTMGRTILSETAITPIPMPMMVAAAKRPSNKR